MKYNMLFENRWAVHSKYRMNNSQASDRFKTNDGSNREYRRKKNPTYQKVEIFYVYTAFKVEVDTKYAREGIIIEEKDSKL